MPAMTYTSLVNKVADYLDRTDMDTFNRIPDFIGDAQHKLSIACKTIGQEEISVGNFIIGNPVYQKPANWIRNISINVGSGVGFNDRNIMQLRTYEFLREYTQNPADALKAGLPLFYSDYGYTNLLVAPTPDQAYPFEFIYLAFPMMLSEDNETNWWTNFAPQVLFSAVMSEAMFFLQNYDRAEAYEAKTQKGIDMINTQDDMRIVDRASARQAD